jgi:hypothetical protein
VKHDGRADRSATTLVSVRCGECARLFSYTEAQKADFYLRDLHPPRRCPACRAYARAERATGPTVAR